MHKRNIIYLTGGLAGMLMLIFDGKTAVEGVRQGIDICLQTLIPSLFPFFVLSGMIMPPLAGQSIPFLKRFGRFCHMPEGSESLLAVGILGGYPVGAGAVWSARQRGQISQKDANRLVVFCNNAGPSFLFGILGPMFPMKIYIWCLWLVQVFAAMLTGFLLGGNREKTEMSTKQSAGPADALNRAIRNMAAVCGWVVLFRMFLEYLDRWILHLLSPAVQVLGSGILELSNGCLRLVSIPDPEIRFLLATVMLSGGGLCILMQTHALFPELNLRQYLSGKLLHLLLSCILSLTALLFIEKQYLLFLVCVIFLVLLVSLLEMGLRKTKIAVAIP